MLLVLFTVVISRSPGLADASKDSDPDEELGLGSRMTYTFFARKMKIAHLYHSKQRRGVSRGKYEEEVSCHLMPPCKRK